MKLISADDVHELVAGLERKVDAMAAPIEVNVVVATIDAGETLSSVIDARTGHISQILMPADWEPATNLTFQSSLDGELFADLFDHKGLEVMLPVVSGTMADVGPLGLSGAYFKLRSGRRDAADLAQTRDRVFSISIVSQ